MAEYSTILSNEELFNLASAAGSPGESIYSQYDGLTDFVSSLGGLNTQEAMAKANQFLQISMAWFDKEVYVEEAYDILEEQGFGRREAMPYMGMLRNLYAKVADSVNPKFKNLQDGDEYFPGIVKKPEVREIFYDLTEDYQNYITIEQVEMRTAFRDEYGISTLVGKIMEGMRNKFIEWMYNKKLDVINNLINSNELKGSQVAEVPMDSYSVAELQGLSNLIDNAISAATLTSNGAFNINGWKYRPRKSDLKVLIRPLIDNTAKNYVTPYAFNDVVLKNGVDKVYVENFGGLKPYVTIEGTKTYVSAVKDNEGRNTNTYKAEGSDTIYTESQIEWEDPNEDVLAVIADKDIMFTIEQEGLVVEPYYNQRTRATTFWFSEANIGFHFDKQKDIIVIKKKQN